MSAVMKAPLWELEGVGAVSGRGYACAGWGKRFWQMSVPAPQFFCEPKSALKEVLIKKIKVLG